MYRYRFLHVWILLMGKVTVQQSIHVRAYILKKKRKLVALLLFSYRCNVTIHVLWLLLTVPWIGLQYVIVVFPDHTHFLYFKFIDMSDKTNKVSQFKYIQRELLEFAIMFWL